MKFRYRIVFNSLLLSLAILFFLSAVTKAQTTGESEPLFESFQQNFKKDYFSVDALLQTVGDFQPERTSGNDGFYIGNARLQISGEFDQGFGYQLQANFIKSSPILDANVYYKLNPGFRIKTGLFKSPFSYEFLTGAAAIDFVNRSTVVNQLAPNRQIGLQIDGQTTDGILRYKLGAFNGNGFGNNRNNDQNFLYTGRLEARFDTDQQQTDNQIIFGVNSSYEVKDQPAALGNIQSTFDGEQILLGTDVRITQGSLMLSGEFIYSWLNSNLNSLQYNPYGYHATAGYFVTPKTQLLARWDYFTGDNLGADSKSIVAGINFFPTQISEIQINYIIPVEQAIDFSQVLLNFQISI